MDTPRTAVVLVGRNPTPALLSCLTLPADHLVLLCSDGTRPTALRVAAAAGRIGAPASARVLSVGPDPHDFSAVAGTLAALHRDHDGRPWFLDYTGGTKVMSVAAALCHEHALPGSGRWRHYLDAAGDVLRPADATRPGLPLSTTGVDLRTLAEVHGARWLDDRDPEPVRLFVQGGTQALLARYPDMSPSVRRGVVAEGRVLSHLRRHLRRQPDTEVLGARQVADPLHPAGAVADFDAVVRHRHRVLCVEAKTRPGDVVARAGWTVAKARRVFGAAAQVLFVYTGPLVPGLRESITDYNPALSARLVHVWNLDDLLRRLTSFDDLRKAFFPSPRGRAARGPGPGPESARGGPPEDSATVGPPRHPGPQDRPVLVTALGGSRLGTLTAVHAHRPARALVLPSAQSLRDNVRVSAARTLHAAEHPAAAPADAALLRETGYRDRVRLTADPVDGSDAEAVAAVAHDWIAKETADTVPPPPVVADITTGTKAMSLGLALAALRAGACVTYQLPADRAVVCRTHGVLPLTGRAAVDWPLVLSGYTLLDGSLAARACRTARTQVDTDLVDAARAALVRAASGPVGVWMDATLTDPEACLTARERPSLVLTFDDRAVGLAAPAWRRRRAHDGRSHGVTPGAWAQSVFAATVHLQSRCDVAGVVVALTRPGGDVGRARELVAWIAHTALEPDEGSARLSFGEPLRPVVVTAPPEALPGLFDTDVSRL
ncbi:CRISPR-associated protein [Nocardiopsis sp. FIRDI 009]|uniref:CRISPR-associated protein n=1 Tax=Nocardiopsis sp. FIRDI 009 TaxID=714197 RepID=UPI000E236F89|nr:CRISPR-associated protein [Nocardiopsis sp. FIRDI 009]